MSELSEKTLFNILVYGCIRASAGSLRCFFLVLCYPLKEIRIFIQRQIDQLIAGVDQVTGFVFQRLICPLIFLLLILMTVVFTTVVIGVYCRISYLLPFTFAKVMMHTLYFLYFVYTLYYLGRHLAQINQIKTRVYQKLCVFFLPESCTTMSFALEQTNSLWLVSLSFLYFVFTMCLVILLFISVLSGNTYFDDIANAIDDSINGTDNLNVTTGTLLDRVFFIYHFQILTIIRRKNLTFHTRQIETRDNLFEV